MVRRERTVVRAHAGGTCAGACRSQAALHAAEYVLRHLVVGFLHFALEVGHHRTDGADYCDNKGPVRHCAQVVDDRLAQRLGSN